MANKLRYCLIRWYIHRSWTVESFDFSSVLFYLLFLSLSICDHCHSFLLSVYIQPLCFSIALFVCIAYFSITEIKQLPQDVRFKFPHCHFGALSKRVCISICHRPTGTSGGPQKSRKQEYQPSFSYWHYVY